MLVLDANILIRAVLGRRVRQLLETCAKRGIRFYAPDVAYAEAQRYLLSPLANRGQSSANLPATLEYLRSLVVPVDSKIFDIHKVDARDRLRGRNEEDWPVLAAALTLGCAIWTEDTDLLGTGPAVWTTNRVEIFLKAQGDRHGEFRIRMARWEDVAELRRLIEASVRGLQARDYSAAQIEGALGHALGLDTQLIEDGTYFVAEATAGARTLRPGAPVLAGCGGWSRRRTLFGSDGGPGRQPELMDPATEAAKIRAIFVHPAWARRGLGSLILRHAEEAARAEGFGELEMGSTLTGVALYQRKEYRETGRAEVPLPNGEVLQVVCMRKSLDPPITLGLVVNEKLE
jgi:predicted nucleic acid-binding protein/ribosomal protein S18 acetylase RimI-like enzyme